MPADGFYVTTKLLPALESIEAYQLWYVLKESCGWLLSTIDSL
jgi:hypothetical protein